MQPRKITYPNFTFTYKTQKVNTEEKTAVERPDDKFSHKEPDSEGDLKQI